MSSILNPGNMPIVTGFLRGVYTAIIAGLAAYVGSLLLGQDEHFARLTGLSVALTGLGGGVVFGGYDQHRANNGIVSSSDVPVAALAQADGSTPEAVARVVEANIKAAPQPTPPTI